MESEPIFTENIIESFDKNDNLQCYITIGLTHSEIEEKIGYFSYYGDNRFHKSQFSYLREYIDFFLEYYGRNTGLYKIEELEYDEESMTMTISGVVTKNVKTSFRFVEVR